MALDGIYLNLLSAELKEALIGAKVDKIYQTQKVELVFTLRSRNGVYRLLMSASGNAPRLHLTVRQIENPANPPMLCMLLRKHLAGATLTDIRQEGFDRILTLEFSAVNELGDRVKRSLVIEIMAQYSNIILLDENDIIIDSVKRVDSSKSSVRQVLPSLPYVLPPSQNKLNILTSSTEEIIKEIQNKNTRLNNALLATVQGMSPLLCREIAYRTDCSDSVSGELTEKQLQKLGFEIDMLKSTIENRYVSPTAVADSDGKLLDFSFIQITQYGKAAKYQRADSLSELLENFYFERERLVRTKSKAEDLFKDINNLIERLSKKINNQLLELEACRDRDEKRINAELINSNLYRLEKGTAVYEVENYYDDNKIVKIPVKPELTPSENAQKYYKEYKKLKTAEDMLTELIAKGREDLEYLRTVLDELNRAETERELGEIRRELYEGGYIKRKASAQGKMPSKQKKSQPMPPLEFTSPDGFKIYVGRNNLQNDKLSLKTALKNDLWFHIQKAPGSHVILSLDGKEPTDEAMEFAAKTAAYYSSGREAGAVEVDYTRVRNLKKPAGAKPGYVIYHEYNSVLVKPEEPKRS
ncbi:MAG: NFACT family protein [Clostridiales bacterium]|nr:NFACT family protein [Clostridiales bacterium]